MITELETVFNANIQNLNISNRLKLKWLRSDGGGEYVSNEVRSWISEKVISSELTTAYSPESNGKAERLKRSLVDMEMTILKHLNIWN